jgi:hypothetical protein
MEASAGKTRAERMARIRDDGLAGLKDVIVEQKRFSEWLVGFAAGSLAFASSRLTGPSAPGAGLTAPVVLKSAAAAFALSVACGILYQRMTNGILMQITNERTRVAESFDAEVAGLDGSGIPDDAAHLESLEAESASQAVQRRERIVSSRRVLTAQEIMFVGGAALLAALIIIS